MIKAKKVIGVCITEIQKSDRGVYLDRLFRYANKHGYKLIIFNSFFDYGLQNSSLNDNGAIYNLIDSKIIDFLVIHSKSFPENRIPDDLRHKAELRDISILQETEFLTDTDESSVGSGFSDASLNPVSELHYTIKDSLFQEDFMYAWLAQIVAAQDINILQSLLAEVILYGSYVCLNNTFLDLLINKPINTNEHFSDELVVLSSQPSSKKTLENRIKRSDIIPKHDEWENDTGAYILNTIHAAGKTYGYYAFRTDNLSGMATPLKRVVSALNLAFCIVSKQFNQNDTRFNIKQAVMAQTDVHLPLNLLIERNLFFYHF